MRATKATPRKGTYILTSRYIQRGKATQQSVRYCRKPISGMIETKQGSKLFLWRYFEKEERMATIVVRKGSDGNAAADCARLNNAWPAVWETTEKANDFDGAVFLTENGCDVDTNPCALAWPWGTDHCFMHPADNQAYAEWLALLPCQDREAILEWEKKTQQRVEAIALDDLKLFKEAKGASGAKRRPHRKCRPGRKMACKEERKADEDLLEKWRYYDAHSPYRARIEDFAKQQSIGIIPCRQALDRAARRRKRIAEAKRPPPGN